MVDVGVAANIKAIIRDKGMIQRAVAERAGFKADSFSAMLNGRKLLLADYLPVIAKALDVTPNELFGIPTTPSPIRRNGEALQDNA